MDAPTDRTAHDGTTGPRVFADRSVAARVDAAETALTIEVAHAAGRRDSSLSVVTMPFAGGTAVWAGDRSPFTKLIGAGLSEAEFASTDAAALETIERAFAERATPVQVELSTLADPALAEHLTARGYRAAGFEHVLGLALPRPPATNRPAASKHSPRVDVSIVDNDSIDMWIDVVVEAALTPDPRDTSIHEDFDSEMLRLAEGDLLGSTGYTCLLARIDGVVTGGAAYRVRNGLVQFGGAGTLAAFRGQGVQSALLAARIEIASSGENDLAVVTVQSGSTAHRNAWAHGFDLLYSRIILQQHDGQA